VTKTERIRALLVKGENAYCEIARIIGCSSSYVSVVHLRMTKPEYYRDWMRRKRARDSAYRIYELERQKIYYRRCQAAKRRVA